MALAFLKHCVLLLGVTALVATGEAMPIRVDLLSILAAFVLAFVSLLMLGERKLSTVFVLFSYGSSVVTAAMILHDRGEGAFAFLLSPRVAILYVAGLLLWALWIAALEVPIARRLKKYLIEDKPYL